MKMEFMSKATSPSNCEIMLLQIRRQSIDLPVYKYRNDKYSAAERLFGANTKAFSSSGMASYGFILTDSVSN